MDCYKSLKYIKRSQRKDYMEGIPGEYTINLNQNIRRWISYIPFINMFGNIYDPDQSLVFLPGMSYKVNIGDHTTNFHLDFASPKYQGVPPTVTLTGQRHYKNTQNVYINNPSGTIALSLEAGANGLPRDIKASKAIITNYHYQNNPHNLDIDMFAGRYTKDINNEVVRQVLESPEYKTVIIENSDMDFGIENVKFSGETLVLRDSELVSKFREVIIDSDEISLTRSKIVSSRNEVSIKSSKAPCLDESCIITAPDKAIKWDAPRPVLTNGSRLFPFIDFDGDSHEDTSVQTENLSSVSNERHTMYTKVK